MIKTKFLHFQKDLKSGMKLDDALRKYDITLKEAIRELHSQPLKRSKK